MTLQEQIEASFGAGPEQPPLELTLAAGHRALRRRRIGATFAAVAVLAVVGTGAGMAATSDTPRTQGRDVQVATGGSSPSPDPSPSDDPSDTGAGGIVQPGPATLFDSNGNLAAYTGDGRVALVAGAEILRRVPDPVGLRPDGDSLGLVVQKGDQTQWLLLDREEYSSGVSFDPAGKGGQVFEEWLALMVDLQAPSTTVDPSHDLVRFGDGETLEPLPGVEILDQQTSPDLPTFAKPRDRSAVAEVSRDGEVWFVLVRQFDEGDAQVIPTRASRADGATSIEEFLAWARPAYTEAAGGGSEGLR